RSPVQRTADVLEGHRQLRGHDLCEHIHLKPCLRPSDLPTRADLFETLSRRTGALSRGGPPLWRGRHFLLGLPGDTGQPVDSPRHTACRAHGRHTQPILLRTVRGQQRRSGAVDAGAPRRCDPHAGDHRHLRRDDQGEPRTVPSRPRDHRKRSYRSGHLAGALGPRAGPGQLDRRRTEGVAQTLWIRVPVPSPPPQHIVTKPISLSERSSSCRSVVIRRAPVEPSGWPKAIAPPLTFTRSMSGESSRFQAATTGAKASLISIRSMSSIFIELRSRILRVAGIGPSSILTGSQPTVVWSTIRARGVSPSSLAFSAVMRSTAAAPSEIWEALPAVMTPSGLNTVLSWLRASMLVS